MDPDPESAPRQDEHAPRRLESRMLTLWWMVSVARATLLGAGVFLAFLLLVPRVNALGWLESAGPWPVIAVLFTWAVVVPPLRFRRWRYALREKDLWIRRGLFWQSVSVIPYRRLQFVDTRQGPFENLFDLAQLDVHTAAPGTSGQIPGLDKSQAERIRERLAELSGAHDAPV